MQICIILYFHNDRWLKRALSIVLEEIEKGNKPIVLDIGHFATPNFGAVYRGLSRIHEGLFPFRRELARLGVEYQDLRQVRGSGQLPPKNLERSFELGIESHCYSLLRTDRIEESSYGRQVRRQIRQKALACFDKSHTFFLTRAFELVYVPNFRYSSQKASLLAAKTLGISTRFFEADGPVNLNMYLNLPYHVHDRVSCQMHARELTRNLSMDELATFVSAYKIQRFGVAPIENQYSARWSEDSGKNFLRQLERVQSRRIGIFTSSVEEMWGLEDDWRAGWKSQWEAIEAVLGLPFLARDKFVLRVHPNLGNKERRYFRREMRHIKLLSERFPNLSVIPHNSKMSSYRLIENLDLVVVFNSTIGLEATILGKPVLRLAPTYYDLLVPCQSAENLLELGKLKEKDLFKTPGWEGAARHVAYRSLRSQALHPEVPLEKNLDYRLPFVTIPISSIPVRLEFRRLWFVISQAVFRRLQNRAIETN